MSVLIYEKLSSEYIGEATVHRMVKEASQEGDDLVTDEGYVVEYSKDGNRVYRCKQCEKSIKTEIGIKSHISRVHKNQGIKRIAPNDANTDDKRRALEKGPEQHDLLEENYLHLDELCESALTSAKSKEEDILNDSFLDNLMSNENESKNISIDSLEEISPDQDHNFIKAASDADVHLQKIKIISLETELRKKDSQLKAREDELLEVRTELSEKMEENDKLKNDIEIKEEACDTAIAKANSLEEKNSELINRLLKHTKTIKSMLADAEKYRGSHDECKAAINMKDKIIKQGLVDKKTLAKRIEQLENTVAVDNAGLSEQNRSTTDKLKVKSKEMKEAQNIIKKASENEKILQNIINDKNRKISELEISLATTKSILEHTKEINSSKNEDSFIKPEFDEPLIKFKTKTSPAKPIKKCRFENSGSCNKKESCSFLHPVATCQAFSRLGSCQDEKKCVYRHPRNICTSWKTYRACKEGEKCRDRHPLEYSGPPPSIPDQRIQRNSSSGGPSPTHNPGWSQGCAQSFLDVGGAAACGPGIAMTSTRTALGCCQDPAYQQQPHHQHLPPHHPVRSHHHGHHQPWSHPGNHGQ